MMRGVGGSKEVNTPELIGETMSMTFVTVSFISQIVS